jgi:signal transduction histidine kinase
MEASGANRPEPVVFQPTPEDRTARAEVGEQFLAGTEHALRTQLAVVKGFAQLVSRRLARHPLDLERTTALAARLDGELRQFEHEIERYLAASRLQWGRWVPPRHPVPLVDLAEQVVARYQQAPERSAQHELVLAGEPDVQGLWDRHWLAEAIAALISNAVLYSPQGGVIRLEIRQTEGEATLTVRDPGIGIPPEEQPHIFQPFVRGQAGRRIAPGWGLGLFITGQVVAYHRGAVLVESRPNQGSTFTLRLPVSPTLPQA